MILLAVSRRMSWCDQFKFNNSGDEPLLAPGFNGIPLEARALRDREFAGPDLCTWNPAPFTARELEMLRLMSSLTERPAWEERVFDTLSMQTWQNEAMQEFPLISPRAWDWCVSELRDKARRNKETGLIMVLNAGAGVCKSDTIVPAALREEIKEFVASAWEHRVGQKNWESTLSPNQQAWNLIDPSLYMLTRERTRVLISGGSIPLEQTLDAYGKGEVAPLLHDIRREWESERDFFSRPYQWLPCEVGFCGPPGSTDMKINSYINHLHPHEQRPFYHTLENVISKAIEPWNETLIRYPHSWPRKYHHAVGREPMRIRTYGVDWNNPYPQWAWELPTTLDVDKSTEQYQHTLARVKEYLTLPEYGLKVQWWFNTTRELPKDWETTLPLREVANIKYSRTFQFQHSEPGTTYSYEDWKAGRTAQAIISREDYDNRDPERWALWIEKMDETVDPMVYHEAISAIHDYDHEFQTVKLQDEFREKGLQVIVKLGGIELTPANPTFLGEDWHMDGMLNEYIAGVAIYCFGLENVTDTRISLTQHIYMDRREFAFDWDEWDVPYLEKLFRIKDDGPALQELGAVPLHQGRLITFPNCLLHRLESFELVDKAQSGHCRFLTLWLVDPYYRICSTRNVPPQRQDWWEQEARSHLASAHPLPQELVDRIIADTQTEPWLMDWPEAEHHQRERAKDEALNHKFLQKEIEHNTICLMKDV